MRVALKSLTTVALALAEASWLAALLALVIPAGTLSWPGLGIGSFWALILLAALLGRWSLAGEADQRWRVRLTLAGAALVVGGLALRAWWTTGTRQPPAFVVLFAGYAWWRGLRLAGQGVTSSVAHAAFGRGALVWAVVAVGQHLAGGQVADLVNGLIVFVGAGLTAMALAALDEARRASAQDGGPALDRTWAAMVGGVIILVSLIGVALAIWLAPSTLERLLAHLAPLVALLSWIARAIATLVALLLTPVLYFLIWLVRRLQGNRPLPELPPPPSPPAFPDEQAQTALVQLPSWVTTLLEAVVVVALVLLGLWILRQALRRYRAADEAGVIETRQIVLSRELLADQLRSLLAGLRARLAAHATDERFLPLDAGDETRRRVRAAYRAFLAAASARDLTRAPGETPAAFARRLAGQPDAPRSALDDLTAAYEPTRYSSVPLDPNQAAAAETAARTLATWLATRNAGEAEHVDLVEG
ncbi:MAG: DUF4129 domain-containing protein [Ardenticatenaceae bacterium]|nr:DUF4129 domain-containing protein [Ardenticatenaceae bacterium]